MRNKFVRVIALTTVTSLLAGCGNVVSEDVASYPLDSFMTAQEVIDYYAESLNYDTNVSKNLKVDEVRYETYEVTGEKADKLKDLTMQVQDLLGKSTYDYSEETEKLLSEDNFHYIKASLNDLALNGGEIKSIEGALGYYFVDVEYNVSPAPAGQFTQKTPLLGINGAFTLDALGDAHVNSPYLEMGVEKLNEYYAVNRIGKSASYDAGTETLTETASAINSGSSADDALIQQEELDELTDELNLDGEPVEGAPTDESSLSTESTEESTTEDIEAGLEEAENADDSLTAPGDADETVSATDGPATDVETTDAEAVNTDAEAPTEDTGISEEDELILDEEAIGDEEFKDDGVINDSQETASSTRKSSVDVEEFNRVVGSSNEQSACMPALDMVYIAPPTTATIQGIGIVPGGELDLSRFGVDKSKIGGTATLRYVFKDTVDGTGNIEGVEVYIVNIATSGGTETFGSSVIIPDFLQTEFDKLIERADRVNVNVDLAGMMNNQIYDDMGFAVLRGYEDQHANVLKNMSVIRNVLFRDTETNSYLLEVETTRREGPRDVDIYATYKDRSYVSVRQEENKFIITDWLRFSRELQVEPPITPDSATEKRVVALGLAGEVGDAEKQQIESLLYDNLYKSGTYRKLTGGELEYRGETVSFDRGINEIFNTDTTMLSSKDRTYMIQELTNKLTALGTDVPAEYSGYVSEWMGGADNQVEFTTEELINYIGRDKAVVQQVYYLVSNMNDEWVIDERRVMTETEISGADINTVVERIASSTKDHVPVSTVKAEQGAEEETASEAATATAETTTAPTPATAE